MNPTPVHVAYSPIAKNALVQIGDPRPSELIPLIPGVLAYAQRGGDELVGLEIEEFDTIDPERWHWLTGAFGLKLVDQLRRIHRLVAGHEQDPRAGITPSGLPVGGFRFEFEVELDPATSDMVAVARRSLDLPIDPEGDPIAVGPSDYDRTNCRLPAISRLNAASSSSSTTLRRTCGCWTRS